MSHNESAARFAKRRREANRAYIDSWLDACVDCGEDDPDLLQPDHEHGSPIRRGRRQINGTQRRRPLIDMAPEHLRTHLDETCEPRCANCHTKRHAQEVAYA